MLILPPIEELPDCMDLQLQKPSCGRLCFSTSPTNKLLCCRRSRRQVCSSDTKLTSTRTRWAFGLAGLVLKALLLAHALPGPLLPGRVAALVNSHPDGP